MNIQIISDIHLEFGPLSLPVDTADVLIAAGDIGLGEAGLAWLQGLSCPVIYVAGNHEYWGHDIEGLTARLSIGAQGSNVHYLEDRACIVDGIRFIGCTLWTDLRAGDPRIVNEIRLSLNDYRHITRGGRTIRPQDIMAIHQASRQWLADTLSEPFAGKTVVVTHHAPLLRSWYHGKNDPLQYAYCNEFSELMESHAIDLWVHGHVHESSDYRAHGTRVVCNPRGYSGYREVDTFEPVKVIEI